jgi:hypothetical protein
VRDLSVLRGKQRFKEDVMIANSVPLDNHRNASFVSVRSSILAWIATPGGGLAVLIVTTLLLRLVFAAALGLGIDESYMVASSRSLQLSYFDHPPVAWWLAWLAVHLGGTDTALVVRLPFILLFALSTWLMFSIVETLFGKKPALYSAVLLNIVPVLGVTSASWVLPDGPLIAALLTSVLCFIHAVRARGGAVWRWWLASGAFAGLALTSKYTAVLIDVGLLGYLVTSPRYAHWLKRPHPYVAMALALAIFSPVVVWNARHGWISLAFQGSRADGGKWHLLGPATTILGESAFFLPWIFVPLCVAIWRAAAGGRSNEARWLILCLGAPSLAVFLLVSLRAHVLFHWAAPALMMTLPLLAQEISLLRWPRKAITAAFVLTLLTLGFGITVVATEVRFNWMPEYLEDFSPANDPDIDAVDWTTLRKQLATREYFHLGMVVAATNWRDAGKIDYALRGRARVVCLGNDPRQFGVTSPAASFDGDDVLIVERGKSPEWVIMRFGADFAQMEVLPPIILMHNGRPSIPLQLILGHKLQIHPRSSQS